MQIFTAVSNSNIYNVCLNTYGSLDFMVKLMTDNSFPSLNEYPSNGQAFVFDETLVNNNNNITSNQNRFKYATRYKKLFNPFNPDDMTKYEQTISFEYTAAIDGETVIILSALIGALRITQLEKEIKPIFAINYSFNPNTGQINLLNGVTLDAGQTIFGLYAKLISS